MTLLSCVSVLYEVLNGWWGVTALRREAKGKVGDVV